MMSAQDARKIVADNIQRLLNKKSVTQTKMADDLGFKETTVSGWMTAQSYPRIDKIQKMADYFGVTRSEITEPYSDVLIKVGGIVRIPVLGKIACGEPITAIENVAEYKERPVDELPSGELFYLKAEGKSMEPIIPDGAHVLIRQQQDAENGEIVAVMSEDMEVTLKYFKKMNGTIMLIPENNEYENILITEKNPIRILGVAMEVWHPARRKTWRS